MYSDVWFVKPGTPGDCFLIGGLASTTAERLAESLNAEFPDCKFWAE
jgi:hypothetical protein